LAVPVTVAVLPNLRVAVTPEVKSVLDAAVIAAVAAAEENTDGHDVGFCTDESILKFEKPTRLQGSGPTRLLVSRNIVVLDLRFPKDEGIVPDNSFVNRRLFCECAVILIVSRSVRLEFNTSYRVVRAVRLPSVDGMLPLSLLAESHLFKKNIRKVLDRKLNKMLQGLKSC
jgi:hypothetical protein